MCPIVSLRSKCFFIHLGVERRYKQGGKHLGERAGRTVAEDLPVAACCLTRGLGHGGVVGSVPGGGGGFLPDCSVLFRNTVLGFLE